MNEPETNDRSVFLNVDIDLRADKGLDKLISALESEVLILNSERGFVSFELSKDPVSVEAAIIEMVRIIKNLPPKGRAIWNKCQSREANIGIRAGTLRPSHFTVSENAVSLLKSVWMALVLTTYPPWRLLTFDDFMDRGGRRGALLPKTTLVGMLSDSYV